MNETDSNIEDDIYSNPLQQVPDFKFDDAVASVFPDMINRSVPGYASVIAVTAVLADKFSQPNTLIYDLGCSLGATSFAMAQAAAEGCRIEAVDSSFAMISRLEQRLQELGNQRAPIKPIHADIVDIDLLPASLIALNFTLQFLPLAKRQQAIKKIYNALLPGGVLILSEKIQLDDNELNELFVELHHGYKRNNGYSELEISQKRDAIENVLVPETLDAHKRRLSAEGFSRIETWFQCFNFISLVAIK